MKILFVSMPSIHAFRWIENLENSGHELFWFDIYDRDETGIPSNVKTFSGWKKRKRQYRKGEYFISSKFPKLYAKVLPFLEVTTSEAFASIVADVKPDVVHSFEMQHSSYQIIDTMLRFPSIKWIYSCWGSDLFYYRNFTSHLRKIKQLLPRVNYLHTDCLRDHQIAVELGFSGRFLGVIPGGTGYHLDDLAAYRQSMDSRKLILVKGYQHGFGRALQVLDALESDILSSALKPFEVVVYAAHRSVIGRIDQKKLPYTYFARHDLPQESLLELMGKAAVSIGNNTSDGMPNTVLEAIIMGAFPIQTNPGGVTEEIITHGENGLLIPDPENVGEIAHLIKTALEDFELRRSAMERNHDIARERLDYAVNNRKVLDIYTTIERGISN